MIILDIKTELEGLLSSYVGKPITQDILNDMAEEVDKFLQDICTNHKLVLISEVQIKYNPEKDNVSLTSSDPDGNIRVKLE